MAENLINHCIERSPIYYPFFDIFILKMLGMK